MKVITVVSAKGGVGKTTLAANLASVLAARGRRVIALDLDPQNALRLHFGIPLDSIDGLSRATLAGDPWQTVMFNGVTVLPYGAVVEDDRRRFESHIDRDPQWLVQTLDTLGLDVADIVIVDTPPGSSVYTRTALCASNFALNVVLADAASYAAIPQMERMIEAYAAPRANIVRGRRNCVADGKFRRFKDLEQPDLHDTPHALRPLDDVFRLDGAARVHPSN
ncbi:MAG: Cellulose synthase, putative [uncultured Caballeronia sp.]|nr:MAG: Cellulose synthase, putative [uncultured Caballeronia sp.]